MRKISLETETVFDSALDEKTAHSGYAQKCGNPPVPKLYLWMGTSWIKCEMKV
jgi:hypothetical protein